MKILQRNKKIVIVLVSLIAVAVVGLLGWAGYSWYKSATVNYAEETAKPIEEALVKAGAKKVCSTGNAGRGPDNREPWYESYFEFSQNREKAFKTINDIATQNGYKLTQASPGNRGFLGIPDEFINDWLFDETSKSTSISGIRSGKIKLAFAVKNEEQKLSEVSCGKPTTITGGAGNSVITLKVVMPEFK